MLDGKHKGSYQMRMNRLPFSKHTQILAMLCEGSSMRSIRGGAPVHAYFGKQFQRVTNGVNCLQGVRFMNPKGPRKTPKIVGNAGVLLGMSGPGYDF